MKIFLSASASAYDKVPETMSELEVLGHEVTPPNGFDTPKQEDVTRQLSPEAYAEWKEAMIREDGRIISNHDAVLVLNFEKNGIPHYIGGAAFLEMFKAFDLGKHLYLYNPIPDSTFSDEIIGLRPVVLHGDISKIPLNRRTSEPSS